MIFSNSLNTFSFVTERHLTRSFRSISIGPSCPSVECQPSCKPFPRLFLTPFFQLLLKYKSKSTASFSKILAIIFYSDNPLVSTSQVVWGFVFDGSSKTETNEPVEFPDWVSALFFPFSRSIISRRFFCIVGTLYLYRCITMYVTTLPVPGMHFNCSPKLFGDWEAQLRRIMKLIAGGGLSITGSHNMCGDYLYSGHTVMLTLTYLFIKEYSHRRLWWYHWICWLLSVVGIFCILLAHDHYTVDVVVAYYITTRLFWWYHTMANQQVLKEASPMNLLARVWWYRPFQYFEKNVQGIVPRSYHWPFPWPVVHLGRQVKYSRLVNDT